MDGVELLGEVSARVRGRRVDPGPARQRCVLAALAVDANRVVPVDRVAERVWGAAPPLRARATLSSYVSRLRHALGGHIVQRSGGYLLEVDEAAVDVHRFRDLVAHARGADDQRAARLLAEALGLWRGEALTGLGGEWAAGERAQLHRERLEAECLLTDARLRLGAGEDLVAELAARTAEHPLDERVAAHYMLALYRGGRAADALEHFRRVRARLAGELGTDPGAALRRLHQRILLEDPELAGRVPVERAAVPRQLPAAPAPFAGRRDELALLDEVADTGRAVVVTAIAGAGGMGKTWLALRWAHDHADRFPDGQLFVDLRGFSPEGAPMPPEVAVRGFLDALGVRPDRVPVDAHARTALFRSLVAGKRLLLVLDNAADTQQVVPLLPGSDTCAVLVTSRNQMPGLVTAHGAHHLPLDVLSDEEARALLANRLGAARIAAEAPAVAELIALCQGFPLALSIIAGRARTQPHLPLALLAAELRDLGPGALDDDRATSLPAVLSWSYRALNHDQAELFGLLGTAPGPDIGVPAAASLAGATTARVRPLLRGLEQSSLIGQSGPGRYRMHDLIRRYAAESAPLTGDQRDAATRRVVDFYLHTAHAADHLLDPHRQPLRLDPPAPGCHPLPHPDEAAALAWFDAEHACLMAAQRAAAAKSWHRAVWQLARTTDTYHVRRGRKQDALTAWRAAVVSADQSGDQAARMESHRVLARAYAQAGLQEQALPHLYRALALAEEAGDRTGEAHTHRAIAWVWSRDHDYRQSMKHAGLALEIYRTLDTPAWTALALSAVGWYAALLGEHDRARSHCLTALAMHREHGNRDGEATTLDSLGYIEHHTGGHAAAVDHYEQALALFRELGYTYEVANTLDNLGHPHVALGQPEQARAVWQEALELYRSQDRDADAERVRRQVDSLARGTGNP